VSLVDQIRARIAVSLADEPLRAAEHAESMRKLYAKDRAQLELCIKAVELAELLGADDEDPDLPQTLARDIRDGLLSQIGRA
jgi:hypothetical protein